MSSIAKLLGIDEGKLLLRQKHADEILKFFPSNLLSGHFCTDNESAIRNA